MLNADDDSRSADRITRLWKNLRCKVDQLSNDIRAGMFYDATIEQVSVVGCCRRAIDTTTTV